VACFEMTSCDRAVSLVTSTEISCGGTSAEVDAAAIGSLMAAMMGNG